VVERNFSWLNPYRRLSKDYEVLPSSSEDDPKLQILTIADLFAGKKPQIPLDPSAFKKISGEDTTQQQKLC
jgi:hypothetical protein